MLISTTRGRCIKRRKSPRVLGMYEWVASVQTEHRDGRSVKKVMWWPQPQHTPLWLAVAAGGGCTLSHPPRFSPHLSSCGVCLLRLHWNMTRFSQWIWIIFFPPTSAMLRVVVESASRIPKKKLGNPDPFAAIVFRGEKCCGFVCLFVCFQREMCVLIYYSFEVYF